MAEQLDQTIRDNAQGPRRAQGDSGSIEQHPLPEQIATDRYLATKAAARKRTRGLRFNKLVPPGSA